MANIRSVALPFTQASGAQLVAAPTKDASGAPVGGDVSVVGFILENTGPALIVILHNGTSAAGPIVAAMSLGVGSGTPTVQDQDYADPRWCDQGLFMEVVGSSPAFKGTVWTQ